MMSSLRKFTFAFSSPDEFFVCSGDAAVYPGDTTDRRDYDEYAEEVDADEDGYGREGGEGEEPNAGNRPEPVSHHHAHGKKKIKPIPPESSMFIFDSKNRYHFIY